MSICWKHLNGNPFNSVRVLFTLLVKHAPMLQVKRINIFFSFSAFISISFCFVNTRKFTKILTIACVCKCGSLKRLAQFALVVWHAPVLLSFCSKNLNFHNQFIWIEQRRQPKTLWVWEDDGIHAVNVDLFYCVEMTNGKNHRIIDAT